MIIFNPTGTLDVNSDPSDLPEQAADGSYVSGAMKRCKNLRLDAPGIAIVRDGSRKLNPTNALAADAEAIVVQGGVRYILAGDQIYRDETEITNGFACAAPEFDPAGGGYAAAQEVTITSDTRGVQIYYTLDGRTPTQSDLHYGGPITLPEVCRLKAIAIKAGFGNSAVTSDYYYITGADIATESGNTLITEGGDNLVLEG